MTKAKQKADLSYAIDILTDAYDKKLRIIKSTAPQFSMSKEIYARNYDQNIQKLSSLSSAIQILRKEQK